MNYFCEEIFKYIYTLYILYIKYMSPFVLVCSLQKKFTLVHKVKCLKHSSSRQDSSTTLEEKDV